MFYRIAVPKTFEKFAGKYLQSSPIIAKVTNTSDGRLLLFVTDSNCRVQKKVFSKSLEIWQVCYYMISPTIDLIVNFDTRLI